MKIKFDRIELGNEQHMILLLDLIFITCIRDSHRWYHKFSFNLKFLPSPNKYPVQITPTDFQWIFLFTATPEPAGSAQRPAE